MRPNDPRPNRRTTAPLRPRSITTTVTYLASVALVVRGTVDQAGAPPVDPECRTERLAGLVVGRERVHGQTL